MWGRRDGERAREADKGRKVKTRGGVSGKASEVGVVVLGRKRTSGAISVESGGYKVDCVVKR